ncbi:MAG: ATP-dependent DNA helicase RecG, partial [Pseudobutyrivibrio sp.]|nr:ATP-dependent DNA helicase RecG [Pseudobutyrivibrio sp.]
MGKTDILVSTTVIEVGVNVPNATVMLIENANRFGLAQLHQLRGRVGRGDAQSYCILMDSEGKKKEEENRLEIMLKSNDGFVISKEDLKLRGPGDIFGLRQSGEFSFRIADIYMDSELIEKASMDVDELLKKDPDLSQNPEIRNAMSHFILNQSYVL